MSPYSLWLQGESGTLRCFQGWNGPQLDSLVVWEKVLSSQGKLCSQ